MPETVFRHYTVSGVSLILILSLVLSPQFPVLPPIIRPASTAEISPSAADAAAADAAHIVRCFAPAADPLRTAHRW
jgi:hypothetical protein